MKCYKCNSTWTSKSVMSKCPFCGENLETVKELRECDVCKKQWESKEDPKVCPFCGEPFGKNQRIESVSEGIKYAIAKYGLDILKNGRALQSYIMDMVSDCDQEKKLLKIAFIHGVGELVYGLSNIKEKAEREVEEKRILKKITDDAFLSEENAYSLMNIFLEGMGIEKMEYVKSYPQFNNKEIVSLSAGFYSTVSLKNDGTVKSSGWNKYGQCNVESWNGVVEISSGRYHTVAVSTDGSALSAGDNSKGQCDVFQWKDISHISAGENHTLGLKKDGTACATGDNSKGQCNVSEWKDLVSISAGEGFSVGVTSYGKVLTTSKCFLDMERLTDVKAVSAGASFVVALKKDGTAVAVGDNSVGQCNVENWKGLSAVCAGSHHVLGLKKDGTVTFAGENKFGQCDVSYWRDVKAVSAYFSHTVGLKKDGTILFAGDRSFGKFDADKLN